MNKSERIEYVCARLRAGETLQKIGDALGLTRERVRQIAADFNVKRVRQPKVPKVYVPKGYRVGPIVHSEVRRACIEAGLSDPYKRFVLHRARAVRHGIPFTLTFEQWWELWKPHYHQRGRRRGNKVMCRYLDAGGYTLGNVAIKTVRENAQERELVRRLKTSMWKRPGPHKSSFNPLLDRGEPAECDPL